MHTAVLVLHVVAAIAIIALVLMQHGKGADMGAAFGSGSAGSLFGSAGAANFLSRSTAVLAAVFFATSLGLTYFSGAPARSGGVTQSLGAEVPKPATDAKKTDVTPAAPAPSAPAQPAAPDAKDSKSGDIPK